MPFSSMTAYGFGEASRNDNTYSCEIRTLNSRFLEVSVRMPRHLLALETEVVQLVKGRLNRGKVDVFIDVSRDGTSKDLPALDENAVRHYARMFDRLQKILEESLVASFAALQDPAAADFFRLEGVLLNPDRLRGSKAAEDHRDGITSALAQALCGVQEARAKEGETLKDALNNLLATMETECNAVQEKRSGILNQLRQNLVGRVETLMEAIREAGDTPASNISEERLAMEVAILSDKADIEEELIRLRSHMGEFRSLLDQSGAVGRKLDFICQEMHREVNTMSNKLVQTEITKHTLNMKQTIERLRQQVQNIE